MQRLTVDRANLDSAASRRTIIRRRDQPIVIKTKKKSARGPRTGGRGGCNEQRARASHCRRHDRSKDFARSCSDHTPAMRTSVHWKVAFGDARIGDERADGNRLIMRCRAGSPHGEAARRTPTIVGVVDMRMPPSWDGVQPIRTCWMRTGNAVVICTAYSDTLGIQQKLGNYRCYLRNHSIASRSARWRRR